MPRVALRLMTAAVLSLTGLFLLAFVVALNSTAREKASGFIQGRLAARSDARTPAVVQPTEAEAEVVTAANRWRPGPFSDAEIENALQRLSRSAVNARVAMGVDINVGREVATLRSQGKWQEGQALQDKVAAERSANETAQAEASNAILDLEAQMFRDPEAVARVAKSFVAKQRDEPSRQMVEQILALQDAPDTAPGRYKSNFGSAAMGAWTRAAY